MTFEMQSSEDFAIQSKGGGRVIMPNVVAEPQFNPTAAYAVNAKVWYGSVQYICTTATAAPAEGQSNPTPEEDVAHWTALPVEEMVKKSTIEPLLFAQYYPEGNVKSAAEFTSGIKYDDPDTTNRTITVKPFCNMGTEEKDNSNLSGRVVIPPFVDASGNGYISDDGTKYKVVGVGSFSGLTNPNTNLTTIVAPNTVIDIGGEAFTYCTSLASASLPAATDIGASAFSSCAALTSVLLPAATGIGDSAFVYCAALTSVDFGNTPRSNVPSLGVFAFSGVPTSCTIIVPDMQYDAWVAADGWRDLVGYKFLKHSEWEYARKYELDGKVPTSRTVNGKALSADVTLTGEDIAYNASTTVSAKLQSVDLAFAEHVADKDNPHGVTKAQIIQARSITTDDIASKAITQDKLADNSVTDEKLQGDGNNGITSKHFKTNAFHGSKLVDGTVTVDKLAKDVDDKFDAKQDALSQTQLNNIDAVPNKASKADATLTPRYADEWTVNPVYPPGKTHHNAPHWNSLMSVWEINFYAPGEAPGVDIAKGTETSTELTFGGGTTATRQSTEHTLLGYQLGPDDSSNPNRDKSIASEAEAEALRMGKVPTSRLVNGKALTSDVTIDYIEHDNAAIYGDRRYIVKATTEPRWMVFGKNSERFSVWSAKYTDAGPGGASGWRFNIHDWLVDKNISSFIRGGEKDVSFTFDILSGTTIKVDRVIQQRSIRILALTAGTGHGGNLAVLDATGNPTDSGMALDDINGTNVRIGQDAAAKQNSVVIGYEASNRAGDNAVVVGYNAVLGNEGKGGGNNCVVIGNSAQVNSEAQNQKAPSDCMAIGKNAKVYLDGSQFGAVQIGEGANREAKSLKFRDTMVVGGNGKIPSANLDVEVAKKSEVPGLSVDSTPSNVNIVHISQDDYEQLVFDDDALSNTLYVVSGDCINAYGETIQNVVMTDDPTESEAATQHYVSSNFVLKSQIQDALSAISAYPLSSLTYTSMLSDVISSVVIVRNMLSSLIAVIQQ